MPPEAAPAVRILERFAAFLAALAFLLRIWTPAPSAGSGLNGLLHVLPAAGLAAWAAARVLARGGSFRVTGLELPALSLALLGAASILGATYRLAAIDPALALAAHAALAVLAAQTLPPRTLARLLWAALASAAVLALVQRFLLFPLIASEAGRTASIELSRRIRTNEPFAAFGGPNQLAGFLALLLPFTAGAFLDTRRPAPAVLAALGLAALALSGSLGGWVALAAGLAAALLLRRGGLAAAVGAGVLGLGGLAYSALPLPEPLHGNHSLHVRDAYSRASRAMVARAPIRGVGLGQWEEHYFELKPEVAQESRKAHNDYLQILAELGLPGLLAFLALLGTGIRAGLRPAPPTGSGEDPPFPAAAVAGVAFLLAAFLADVVGGLVALLLSVSWLAARFAVRDVLPGPAARLGAFGGLVAFAVHLLVDYDFSEPGPAAACMMLLVWLCAPGRERPVPRPAAVLGCVALAAGVAVLLAGPIPRALAAHRELRAAPGLPTKDAFRLLDAARTHNPLDAEAHRIQARLLFEEWSRLKAAGGKGVDDLRLAALQAIDAAIEVRPRHSPLHFIRSRMLLAFGDRAGALESQRRAHALYPTYPGNAYALARLEDGERAREFYAEALRLSDLAGKELENLDRLKLPAAARARALTVLGRPEEARAALADFLRRLAGDAPPAEARKRAEAWLRALEDEQDDLMRPVLQAAVDAIIPPSRP